jgi:hypothetical protein
MSSAGTTAYVHGVRIDRSARDRDDFTPTPPDGTRRLLAVERFEGTIWECACGEGHMARELAAAGYDDVMATDLIDRGFGQGRVDFLLDFQTTADNIVTNPPYKFADQFVEHALKRTRRKVAMLLRLGWLTAGKRRKLIESTPLARVLVFAPRLQMWRGRLPEPGDGKSMVDSAWFVWDKAHKGPWTGRLI